MWLLPAAAALRASVRRGTPRRAGPDPGQPWLAGRGAPIRTHRRGPAATPPSAWAPVLAGPARHGWVSRDVNQLIRDWIGVRALAARPPAQADRAAGRDAGLARLTLTEDGPPPPTWPARPPSSPRTAHSWPRSWRRARTRQPRARRPGGVRQSRPRRRARRRGRRHRPGGAPPHPHRGHRRGAPGRGHPRCPRTRPVSLMDSR